MQMQTKRTTSRIPNLHKHVFHSHESRDETSACVSCVPAVLFVERANELSDYFLKQQTKPPSTTQATPR